MNFSTKKSDASTCSLGDQHHNRKVLDEWSRSNLTRLALTPLSEQIKEFYSFEQWRDRYLQVKIENKKLDQILALERLQSWLKKEHERSEESRTFKFLWEDIPSSKEKQYKQGLAECRKKYPNEPCERFVQAYIGAERAFETWAKESKLDCVDLNASDPWSKQDYRVNGLNVDVKTTLNYGQTGLKNHWFRKGIDANEIICAVHSSWEDDGRQKSHYVLHKGHHDDQQKYYHHHYVQGIFHATVYREIARELKYFPPTNNSLNACYFHPPENFFGVMGSPEPQVPPLDQDVVEYCARNAKYLSAILRLPRPDATVLLKNVLPECHQDFVPLAAELMNRNMRHLLPLYQADYILTKIGLKETMKLDDVNDISSSIFEPNEYQKLYLESLLRVAKILPKVRCIDCDDSHGIDEMDIEVRWGREERVVPIVRARCKYKPKAHTTVLAYSRKTFETLVYGNAGVSVCGKECGCLTHIYDGQRIGKTGCPRYGGSD
jgi:hypothetical protein